MKFVDDLPNGLKQIYEIVGLEKFIELYNNFEKTYVHFSTKPFINGIKKFILINKDQSAKELAKSLNVSESYIYKTIQEQNKSYEELNNLKI
ncbi:MAG: HTH domain-containing protein [Ignavibacteriae bacterium]|nr:HTH domain-containing protein [Ignavibacteriota bacterium]